MILRIAAGLDVTYIHRMDRPRVMLAEDHAPIAEQLRKLPPFIAGYLEPRYLASIRSGTAAFTGAPMLPGGAGAIFSGAGGAGGPGGATTVIISRP